MMYRQHSRLSATSISQQISLNQRLSPWILTDLHTSFHASGRGYAASQGNLAGSIDSVATRWLNGDQRLLICNGDFVQLLADDVQDCIHNLTNIAITLRDHWNELCVRNAVNLSVTQDAMCKREPFTRFCCIHMNTFAAAFNSLLDFVEIIGRHNKDRVGVVHRTLQLKHGLIGQQV